MTHMTNQHQRQSHTTIPPARGEIACVCGTLVGGGLLAVPDTFYSIARGPFAVALDGGAQQPTSLTMKPCARPPLIARGQHERTTPPAI